MFGATQATTLAQHGVAKIPGVYIWEDYADNHTPASVGLSTTLTGGGGVLNATAAGQYLRSAADKSWALYSPYAGLDIPGDLDAEVAVRFQRTFTGSNFVGPKIIFDTPAATGTYKTWFIDLYSYASPLRGFRAVYNESTNTVATLATTWNAVAEAVIRITKRTNFVTAKIYRTSDMAFMGAVSQAHPAMYAAVSNIRFSPQNSWQTGNVAWLRSAKVTAAGILYPSGI